MSRAGVYHSAVGKGADSVGGGLTFTPPQIDGSVMATLSSVNGRRSAEPVGAPRGHIGRGIGQLVTGRSWAGCLGPATRLGFRLGPGQ